MFFSSFPRRRESKSLWKYEHISFCFYQADRFFIHNRGADRRRVMRKQAELDCAVRGVRSSTLLGGMLTPWFDLL